MKTVMPQEIETFYLIPAIKREMAKAMVKKKIRQAEIARKLGVAESAVSQYLSSKRGAEVNLGPEVKKEIAKAAEAILNGSSSIEEIGRVCRLCRDGMLLCKLHKKSCTIPDGCRICFDR